MKEYVSHSDGVYRISETRVSLDSVVYAWRDGLTPESIRANFPVLTLEEVYGAITFYLANQPAIDVYLSVNEAKFATARQQSLEQLRQHKPHLYARLLAAKRQQAAAPRVPEPAHP
jgi:uncharacterized protein (DUF433 family)